MATPPLTEALQARPVLVLDGAMATELERHGADLSGGLWSARVLAERPDLVGRVHADYLAAGADVITTASYQASVAGFAAHGIPRAEGERLIRLSVELARTARDEWVAAGGMSGTAGGRLRPVVATSVGPYGAVLADGSEYRGDYDIGYPDLVRFHRKRLEVLVAAGVEVLACETIPSLVEARALVEAFSAWPEVGAWVSFSARDGQHVSDGTPLADCARFLGGCDQVVAVGVNCVPVRHVPSLLQRLAGATDLPLVVYPNSGEEWDPVRRSWVRPGINAGSGVGAGAPPDFGPLSLDWAAAGARVVGGCCRTGPREIEAVARAVTLAATAPQRAH